MKNNFFTSIIALLVFSTAVAQENRLAQKQPNTAEIYHHIEKLGFLGTALYVAAHPDDENTRLISWLANDKMARTGYLSLTRGDGGQNLIGPQLREQLGMIRTQELLEARYIDGGQQFFTRANDFGYSKHPDETLEIWNEQEVMEDMVRIIREFQPDVIINRFDHRTPGSTHGHHTASAMLSMKVFEYAADKTMYAYQLKELDTWQAPRVYFNTSWWFYGSEKAFDKSDKTNLLEIDAGTYYPHKGLSNSEIAALSRSQHKSQGFGSSGSRGSQTEYLEYLKGSFPTDKSDLFSGINTTWTRVKGGSRIQTVLNAVIASYNFKNPTASIPALLELRNNLENLKDKHWKKIKLEELDQILLDICGVYLEASVNTSTATAGESISVAIELTNRSNETFQISLLPNQILQTEENKITLNKDDSKSVKANLQIPAIYEASTPYYLKEEGSLGMYQFKDRKLTGQPETAPDFMIRTMMEIQGTQLYREIPIIHKHTDPVRGEVNEPFYIVPEVAVSIQNPVYIFSGDDAQPIQVTIKANKKMPQGNLELLPPDGWSITPQDFGFENLEKGEEKTYTFQVQPPKKASRGVISGLVKIGLQTFNQEVIKINYDHIPDQQLVRNSASQVVKPGLINRANTVAYINGAGDDVAQAIEAIGSKVFKFEPNEVPDDLSKYDAVVVGIRAFNVSENDMDALQPRLDSYVKNGGTLLMQYNTSRRISPDALGPLPITLSRKRVTDENATVTILEPQHKIMTAPNAITSTDFTGWVQERGLYFPEQWDAAFTPILGMNDKEEEMTKGSLLVAEYGAGHIIYTGLSLFRELPAGVSGAYKLLANIISIGVEDQSIENEDGKRKL
ncbi:MAG: LmbE family N-acetylglucosaminyl deacetylase [Nonlabens sp.]|jgi:LmbE family N-acetylglucosaminyl deacetylase|uniref:PIG-L family deacetylase n=1 Tax=Nonlabens sp. TaxID=1888209 RepID=UPI0039E4D497